MRLQKVPPRSIMPRSKTWGLEMPRGKMTQTSEAEAEARRSAVCRQRSIAVFQELTKGAVRVWRFDVVDDVMGLGLLSGRARKRIRCQYNGEHHWRAVFCFKLLWWRAITFWGSGWIGALSTCCISDRCCGSLALFRAFELLSSLQLDAV